ncbi:MAG: DUF1080 domain-containing protein [Ignavibacteriales bacterium]|nr:DUF1080 domain-containing protein [Ignavibacteriales bacterium]
MASATGADGDRPPGHRVLRAVPDFKGRVPVVPCLVSGDGGRETGYTRGRTEAFRKGVRHAPARPQSRCRHTPVAHCVGVLRMPAGLKRPAGAAPRPRPEPAWTDLFAADLSNAEFPAGIWTVADGVMTASEDQAVWTKQDYENFVLDLEFMTAPGTNSGVIVYCSDTANWIPNSVEIQIADDFADEWAKAPATWHCGAIFGHLAPTKSAVKPAGEWNHYTITCAGKRITVVLNGETVTDMDMSALDLGQGQSRRERDPGLARAGPRRSSRRRAGSASRASTPARRSISGISGSGQRAERVGL